MSELKIRSYTGGQCTLIMEYYDSVLKQQVTLTNRREVRTGQIEKSFTDTLKLRLSAIDTPIEYDPESEADMAWINAICADPRVLIKGKAITDHWAKNKEGVSSQAIVTFSEGVQAAVGATILEKYHAQAKYHETKEFEKKQLIGYIFGVDAYNKKESELAEILIGENANGKLMQPENIKTFLALDLNKPEVKLKAIINKGIFRNYILGTNVGGKTHYSWSTASSFNGESIGVGFDELRAYFAANPHKEEYLTNQLWKVSVSEEKDVPAIKEPKELKDKKQLNDLKELQKKAEASAPATV